MSLRAVVIGIVVSALFVAVKVGAGVAGNSWALVADGIESLADIFSAFIVFTSVRFAVRPPDDNHPFGHGRAEALAGLAVALVLLVAGVVICQESVREITLPHDGPEPFTLVVLVAVVLVKELLFRRMHREGVRAGSVAVRVDAWHQRSDAITSACAAIGISIALIGGRGFEAADDWAALVACLLIFWNGARLLGTAINELMDAAIDPRVIAAIRAEADRVPAAAAIEKVRVRKSGFHYFVELHVEVPGSLSVREGHDIAHDVKAAVQAAFPSVLDAVVHIEPQREPAPPPSGD